MIDRIPDLRLSPELLANRKFRFLPEADRSLFRGIDRGVVFVMAFWSGPAFQAFAVLKRVLTQHDSGGSLELVVVDTDGCPDIYEMPEFVGKLHGAGEAAWVLDAQIVSTSGLGFHPECFAPNTLALLNFKAARSDS